jgi:DNA-binding NtrC family response regulator
MTSSNARASTAPSDDLTGMRVLLVEDSWQVGQAMKRLLQVLGAEVSGPAANEAEAERLFSEQTPDLALVDFHLRDGERATGLIDRLHERGVPVIVITGYAVLPAAPKNVVTILQKPVTTERLLAAWRPFTARKPAS